MSLAPIVRLYRLAERPAVHGSRFRGSVSFERGIDAIEAVRGREEWDSHLTELLIDGEEYEDGEPLPEHGEEISFEVMLHANSTSIFHEDIDALVRRCSRSGLGEMPSDYYLINEDFYSEEDDPPEDVRTLERLTRLAAAVASLADYCDEKRETPKLVFLVPDGESSATSVEVEARITPEILHLATGLTDEKFEVVEQLAHEDPANDAHYSAKRGVFGNSVAEFVQTRPRGQSSFAYLIENWGEFVSLFNNSVNTYISGFAFHKAKQEVASAEFDLTSKFSQVTTGIIGKLLSVPVSMVAVAAMVQADGLFAKSLIFIGVVLASMLLAGAVWNQREALKGIKHSKEVTLRAIEGKRDAYPIELQKDIEKMEGHLKRQEDRLGAWLWGYFAMCLVPPIAGSVVLLESLWPVVSFDWLTVVCPAIFG